MTHNNLFPEHVQPQLGRIFAAELKEHAWSGELEPFYSRLRATERVISEVSDLQQPFSVALWNLCFPPFSGAEFWHYTMLEGLTGIIESQEIWLHPLSKRMSETELTAFASEFGYRGLLDFDPEGLRTADQYARDLFFLSLTDEDLPGEMWNFGEVRLRFRITPVAARAEVRRVAYSAGNDHPLKVLKAFARSRFGRDFVPGQVSNKCAFFLDSGYDSESEVRLIIKRFEANTDLVVRKSGPWEAIAIPIGKENPRVMIDLVRMEAETVQALQEAERLLARVAHWQVPCCVYQP